jgi:hypothetical protein
MAGGITTEFDRQRTLASGATAIRVKILAVSREGGTADRSGARLDLEA